MAQHVDGMDTSTLIDIFRSEEDLCLLGTDAVRDGVDLRVSEPDVRSPPPGHECRAGWCTRLDGPSTVGT